MNICYCALHKLCYYKNDHSQRLKTLWHCSPHPTVYAIHSALMMANALSEKPESTHCLEFTCLYRSTRDVGHTKHRLCRVQCRDLGNVFAGVSLQQQQPQHNRKPFAKTGSRTRPVGVLYFFATSFVDRRASNHQQS